MNGVARVSPHRQTPLHQQLVFVFELGESTLEGTACPVALTESPKTIAVL